MKVYKIKFDDTEIIQIYINRQESEDEKCNKEIEQLKTENKNVAIFVSGKNNTIKTIEDMLNYEKSRKM